MAIFACHGAGEFFEALQFSAPLSDNRIQVYHQPHLYHYTNYSEQYPRYAAVLTDANETRIFVSDSARRSTSRRSRAKRYTG